MVEKLRFNCKPFAEVKENFKHFGKWGTEEQQFELFALGEAAGVSHEINHNAFVKYWEFVKKTSAFTETNAEAWKAWCACMRTTKELRDALDAVLSHPINQQALKEAEGE